MPSFDEDPPTPADEAAAEDAAASDAHYGAYELAALELADQLAKADDLVDELIAERDMARRELAAAVAELDLMRASRDALFRYIELNKDYLPSEPKDRPRFAGESMDDYQLRGA